MRLWKLLLAGVLLVLSVCVHAASRPNFILVLIDDLGYGDFSCYGNDRVQTTNIDRLANEGIRFTQFYVGAPICSPSRTAFMTGQFPARWGMTSYLASRKENEERRMPDWLNPHAPSLARILREAGYRTGHFGKWHLGGQRDVGDAPLITEYGFDQSLTQFEGLGDRILPLCDAYDGKPAQKHALGSDNLGRGTIRWEDRSKVTSVFVKRALEFIKAAEAAQQPFYINLWTDDVHSPFFPPKELRGNGTKRDRYLGVLKELDDQLAPLFAYLRDRPSLQSNTLIMVTSDNGPEPGAGHAGSLRGHKGNLYEGGVRAPLVVWGAGVIAEKARGTVNDKTVLAAVDLAPSLARLAGARLPSGVAFDGEDLSASLLGEVQQVRTKALMWNRPPDRPGNGIDIWPDLALRSGDWKLLMMNDGSAAQLYDLGKDSGESRNLAADQPEVVKRLTAELQSWRNTLPASNRTGTPRSAAGRTFLNPIAEGSDPWVIKHEGRYIACLSEANRGIALYISDRLSSLGQKHVIWRAPAEGMCSAEIWAPEIHFLDGRWHVYFAASNGENRNHRMWILESKGSDPLGPYSLHGPIYTGDEPSTGANNRWAIDGTIMELDRLRYMVWSGWQDDRDVQWLYLAPMKDSRTITAARVKLCNNDDYLWERVDENERGRGLHEAPQVLQRSGRTFLVYSCSGSWQPSYKLGLLELREGGNPLKASDWIKHPKPVFQPDGPIFGVGHNCFVKSPDDLEDWLVYHAKLDRRNGWRRALYAQPFRWGPDGLPDFGSPAIAALPLRLPSGEMPGPLTGPFRADFRNETSLANWNYYGHHQFIALREDGLHLGAVPAHPINEYRCGEKVLVKDGAWGDFSAQARLKIVQGDRDAGLLFRCSLASVGYDAQSGYFAGIIPRTGKVVLGRTNGRTWRERALADADIQVGREYVLGVTASGSEIVVSLDGKEVLRATDSQHTSGSIGLRVVDVHAVFSSLEVKAQTRHPAGRRSALLRGSAEPSPIWN